MQKEYPLNLHVPEKGHTGNHLQCLDFKTFLHLNPNWEILNQELKGDAYTLFIKEYESEEEYSYTGTFIHTSPKSVEFTLDSGDISSITIRIRNRSFICDVAYRTNQVNDEHEAQVVFWLRAIQQYIRLYLKNTPYNLFYRLLMNKMILDMTPSQRKISLMIYRFTLVEILVLFIIIVGYVFFVL